MTVKSQHLEVNQYSLPYLNITPKNIDSHALIQHIQTLGAQTSQTAVTLDLKNIKSLESPAWLREIRATLKQYNMTLIGVYNPQLNLEICKALKIPVLNEIKPAQEKADTENITYSTDYVHKPVRTGQQIYAKNRSVAILKGVSSGAEVAARDNVYVYGSANGKIIAGASGNQLARIFIQEGYPELISIAGVTWISDQINPATQPQQFYLKDGQLQQENL